MSQPKDLLELYAADEARPRFRKNFRKALKTDLTALLLSIRTSCFCGRSGEQMTQGIAGLPLALVRARLEDNVDPIWSSLLRFPAEPLRLGGKCGCRLPHVFRHLRGIPGRALDEAGSRRSSQLDAQKPSPSAYLTRRRFSRSSAKGAELSSEGKGGSSA